MNSRQRRTFNRAVEKAAQSTGTREQSKTKHKTLPEPPAQRLRWLRSIWSAGKILYAAIGAILGLLALFYELWPAVSIEPYLYLDPRNPFSAQFNITNESPYSLKNLTYRCRLNAVESELHVTIQGAEGRDESTHSIPQINAKQKISVTCPFPIEIGHLIKADIGFQLSYFFSHWQITKDTCFHGELDIQKNLQWTYSACS
jgi:hypothetical protein